MDHELCQSLVTLRRNHPAWVLLASHRGPLIIASLKSLFDAHSDGITLEDAQEHLSEEFENYANDPAFDLSSNEEPQTAARRELREWLKRGLIVERGGEIFATDALQRSFGFLQSLENQTMTSTASRLATVQQAILELESKLSPDQAKRAESLKARIQDLQNELAAVERGDFEVMDGPQAQEGIREVYQLAISLRADFHRVEDSYRQADRELRKRILSENHHRGEIVEAMLHSHEQLLNTSEGQVFESFHKQLQQSSALAEMKKRLRAILNNENTEQALDRNQKEDLGQLVRRLIQESERVSQARARSDRDVRGFLQSGLVDEQIRVGAILQELFQVAENVNWQSQTIRRAKSPLQPIGMSVPKVPVVERLLVKNADVEDSGELDFSISQADPAELGDEFWYAYRALDRAQLFETTIAYLRKAELPLTIGQLVRALPPTHDLETLAYWLAMAREAGINIDDQMESIDIEDTSQSVTRFYVPYVQVSHNSV